MKKTIEAQCILFYLVEKRRYYFPTAEDIFKMARSLVSWVTNANVKNAIDAYAEATGQLLLN